MFERYLKNGLVKKQTPNFKQIAKQMSRAHKDVKAAKHMIRTDPEWAAAIAYHAMLRSGRACMYAHGFLPSDGRQHLTVVEIMDKLLGSDCEILVARFEKMRRKRNVFFYEPDLEASRTEAENALCAAQEFIALIETFIGRKNPQLTFGETDE